MPYVIPNRLSNFRQPNLARGIVWVRSFFVLVVLVSVGTLGANTWAQDLGLTAGGLKSGSSPMQVPGAHEFRLIHDQSGAELLEGGFWSLEGATLTMVDSGGEKHDFGIKEISDEDQKWAKDKSVAARKFKLAQKEAEKIITMMSRDKTANVVKSLNRLKKTGQAAAHMAQTLVPFFEHEDAKVRRVAFATYAHICRKTESDFNRLLDELDKNDAMHDSLGHQPRDFLLGMASFGDRGMDYVRNVAFDCSLRQKKKPSNDPIKLKVAGGDQSKIRTEACKVLGEFTGKEQREYAADYLLSLIDVSKKHIDGEYEDKTLKASIKSLGQLGYYSSDIHNTMKELYKDFPEETKDAMKKLLPPKKGAPAKSDK